MSFSCNLRWSVGSFEKFIAWVLPAAGFAVIYKDMTDVCTQDEPSRDRAEMKGLRKEG